MLTRSSSESATTRSKRHRSWPAGPWLGVAAGLLVAAEQPSKPQEAPVASATSSTEPPDKIPGAVARHRRSARSAVTWRGGRVLCEGCWWIAEAAFVVESAVRGPMSAGMLVSVPVAAGLLTGVGGVRVRSWGRLVTTRLH